MAGTGNEEEASARIAAALGLPSYPTSIDETLRICTWLKSRPASVGFLGEWHLHAHTHIHTHTDACTYAWTFVYKTHACAYTCLLMHTDTHAHGPNACNDVPE